MAKIWLRDREINWEVFREGYAWAYRDYLRDFTLVADERAAKDAEIGLWVREDPILPWEWRRRER